jgi:tRNA A37 threonylcarbamoyladenosine synthetase subunit TsaC/SUA5/YrdC
MNIHNQLDHLEQAMSRFLSPVHNEEQKALVKKLYADLPDNEVLQTDLEFCAQMALTLIGPLSTLSPVKQVPTEVECSKKSIALNMVDDTSLVKSALTPSGEYIFATSANARPSICCGVYYCRAEAFVAAYLYGSALWLGNSRGEAIHSTACSF